MKARTACLPVQRLEAHNAGKLTPEQADHVRAHIEECSRCFVVMVGVIKRKSKVGDILDGRYELTAEIGKGGMGVVWEARHAAEGLVAIKVLTTSNPDHIRRVVEREARIGLKMQHAGFVRIRELLTLEGKRPALVMDRLFGCTLAQSMQDAKPLAVPVVQYVLRGIAAALGVLHALQVAHRDLSANNIYLESDPASPNGFRVRILDLGFARSQDSGTVSGKTITRHGAVFGTAGFMAPEQQLGLGDIGTAADIWSLGALAYYMLTANRYPGTPKGDGGDTKLHLTADLSGLPRQTPEALRKLIESSLEIDPAKRPSAQVWIETLDAQSR